MDYVNVDLDKISSAVSSEEVSMTAMDVTVIEGTKEGREGEGETEMEGGDGAGGEEMLEGNECEGGASGSAPSKRESIYANATMIAGKVVDPCQYYMDLCN